MSKFHFQRIFTEWAGISPKKFLACLTLQELKKNIHRHPNIIALSESVGLSSSSRVHDLFLKIEAVTPLEYKQKGQGITIQYGFHPTPFGACLLACTPRGICALEFVEENQALALTRLKEKWSNANFVNDVQATQHWVKVIFERKNLSSSCLKLWLWGTPFQLKVWEALLNIPSGGLISYAHVSKFIQQPNGHRAVGTAVGKNPIAYLIPCHRVIRKTGALGGYRWGMERKLALLGKELS